MCEGLAYSSPQQHQECTMFKLISPLSKVVILTLSAGLTWSTVGSLVDGFQTSGSPTMPVVTLAPVLVVGHREAATVVTQPEAVARALPLETKLTKVSAPNKNSAI
jgi:hypothetical protein